MQMPKHHASHIMELHLRCGVGAQHDSVDARFECAIHCADGVCIGGAQQDARVRVIKALARCYQILCWDNGPVKCIDDYNPTRVRVLAFSATS